MNQAHLHMILVHIPIVLMPTATVLLIIGMWRGQVTVATTARALFVVTSLLTVPVFLLGEGAEEIVESLAGVTKSSIHDHEEIADIAFWITVITGLQALATFLSQKSLGRLQQTMVKALILSGSLASVCLAYTAYEGGKIRHPEAYGPSSLTTDHRENDD